MAGLAKLPKFCFSSWPCSAQRCSYSCSIQNIPRRRLEFGCCLGWSNIKRRWRCVQGFDFEYEYEYEHEHEHEHEHEGGGRRAGGERRGANVLLKPRMKSDGDFWGEGEVPSEPQTWIAMDVFFNYGL